MHFSRMYLAVHFPTDVAVGLVIGVTMAILGYRFFEKKVSFSDLDK